MANRWLKHLQQFRQRNAEMDPKKVMKEARKTYQSGGGDVTPYQPTNLASTASALSGGRRRRSQRRRSSSRRRSQTRRR